MFDHSLLKPFKDINSFMKALYIVKKTSLFLTKGDIITSIEKFNRNLFKAQLIKIN